MTSRLLDAYLIQLARELRKHGLSDGRIVEEAREHLVDAIEEGLRRGLSIEAAEREAFARFGPAAMVAADSATGRYPMLKWLLAVPSRVATSLRRQEPHSGHYHDVSAPSVVHFALRVKRRYRATFARMSADERKAFAAEMRSRGEDVAALEPDPQERLAQFLREFGRRTFGSSEVLESLTLLEDMTDASRRGGRYLASLGSRGTMVWTVTLRPDGGVSFDGTSSPA